MNQRRPIHRLPPEATEVDQIRTLFQAFNPSAIFTGIFLAVGLVTFQASGDGVILLLLVLGMTASVARLIIAWMLAASAADPKLALPAARRLERRFAIPYLAFAVLLGLFGARAFMLPLPQIHMLTICMLMGYCAGVALGMGLRMWIAVPAMFVAGFPAVGVALLQGGIFHWTMSAMVVALLLGGANALWKRHERSVEDIGMRHAFASLARKDALTALPNRIGLREWYDERAGRNGLLAVHYIDLNGFKPVNDSYGHPVGDALLTMVGKRIARTIRDTDIAARLGGDEFVVVQNGLADAADAAGLAARLTQVIAQPYRIGEHRITISAGLGYVLSDGFDDDLDHLLGLADKALYTSKRSEGAVMQYEAVEPLPQRAA